MSDRILLHRIAIYAHHGVFDAEKSLGQRFYISIEARLDLAPAACSDDVADTVHYGELALLAHGIATNERFHLIEALAGRIADAALAAFPPIHSITVQVEKPGAPIPLALDGVTVEVTRVRARS